MRELFRLSILKVICILAVVGCSNVTNSNSSKVRAKIEGDVLVIDADSTKRHTIQVSIGKITFSTSLRGGEEFKLMDSLKHHKDVHYELAYTLAQNYGLMDAHLSIPSKLDTTIQCQFKYNDIWGHSGQLTSGKFAKIINTFDSENIDSEIRRWVYKNKKVNIGDSLFNDMRLYLRDLSTTTNTQFVVQGTIPSIKSLDLRGAPYNVSSDMVADNYFLFACDEDEDLDYFIEEMIARNMSDAKKSLSTPLNCFRQNNARGTQCLFLIGINNDWTSQVLPLGVISIDSTAPEYGIYGTFDESYTELVFPERGFVVDVSNHPKVSGWWSVDSGNWQGYGTYLRVPFTFSWGGDVAKFTFDRGDGKITTINLEGKESPYHIDITCKIELGDNYYEVKAYDKLGNSSKYDYHIGAKEVKDENPQIDIDNNIWN